MAVSVPVVAQGPDSISQALEGRRSHYADIAQQIWNFAEVGYQEQRSSELLQSELRSAGFEIESGGAGMPTAFVASYGTGSPVIGILAEFDALPGIAPIKRSAPFL